MTIKFNENVEICYKDKKIYINNNQFEYNSKLNKQIKTDFFYFLLMIVHRKKLDYNHNDLLLLLEKEKYINYNKFLKLLLFVKNKLLLGDFVFSFNGYTISYKRRNLYRKWLIYVLKYDKECCIRIQSLIRGYLVRNKKIEVKRKLL